MFGRHPRIPVDIAMNVGSIDRPMERKGSGYITELRGEMQRAHKIASDTIQKKGKKGREDCDKKVRSATLEEGDRVLVRNVGLQG